VTAWRRGGGTSRGWGPETRTHAQGASGKYSVQ
jgi:hypothetical protein